RREGRAGQFAADRHDARLEVERCLYADVGEMNRIPRLETRRLPDSALHAVPVLLGGERLAEAAAIAVVGDARVDAEHERGLGPKRLGEVDLDRSPAVAVDRDRRLVDEDHRFVEDALQNENNAFSRPFLRDLDAAAVASNPLRVAQCGKLRLPDPGRSDRAPLAVEPRGRTFEFEVPEAVERKRCAASRDVTIHLRLRDGRAAESGASRASKRCPRLAEQARMSLVEPEADGLTRLRVEIAFALDDELPGRSVDIEDRRIPQMFDDRDGAGERRLRIVRID